MKHARKPLAGLIALGAALALPVAFAQDANTQDPPEAYDPTSQHATPQPAPEPTDSQPLTWADVDADGDGKLSRDEAARVPTLAQVFEDADADSDGLLTQEEYQAYVAQNDSSAPSPTDGGDD